MRLTLICLFSVLLYSFPLSASDQQSQTTGPSAFLETILYVGGSGPGNYSKIQDAIDDASAGDTVFVYSGLYEENIIISTSIDLIGEGKDTTVIDGMRYSSVIVISADNTQIQNFTVQNAKEDIHSAGIQITDAGDVLVSDNIIQENAGFGISLQGSGTARTRIECNTIRNNSYGIYVFNSPAVKIKANTVYDNEEGIYVIGSFASEIINNTVSSRDLGVHLESTSAVLVRGNFVVNNANGMYAFNSSEITFYDNTIGWNRWYGLWLKDTSYCVVNHNDISTNIDVGLFLESSYDTIVTNNTLWDNDNGIYLKDSAGNLIQNNNLRNYKVNGCFVAHTLVHRRNIWRMNYWERARLLPYPILGYIKLEKVTLSWMNIDWAPLHSPPTSPGKQRLSCDETIFYVGGNGPNNYTSIQEAVDDAGDNDTVYVFNGTYYEAVFINKSLRLIGENKTITILEGNGTRDIITIQADYVTVTGFTIFNGHFNILVNHSSHGNISGNIIGSGLQGISVQNGCRQLSITKNSFPDNVYGVRLYSSIDVTVSLNSFQSFKINAFYFGTSITHGRHHWYQNYWGKPRNLPYVISGKIRLGNFSLIWLNFDWSPVSSPV